MSRPAKTNPVAVNVERVRPMYRVRFENGYLSVTDDVQIVSNAGEATVFRHMSEAIGAHERSVWWRLRAWVETVEGQG